MVRVLRPTSSIPPSAAWRSTTRPASQATRRAASDADVETPGLLNDRLPGVGAAYRGRLVAAVRCRGAL